MTGPARLLLVGIAGLSGCGGPPPIRHSLTVAALVDAELPLAGVRVSASGRPLGATDASGRLHAEIEGREGQEVALAAQCPPGYRGPPGPEVLRLSTIRSLLPSSGELLVSVACRPSRRHVAIVLLASGVEGLTVLVDGVPRARTDRDGVAHVLALGAPGDILTVALDTTAREELLPFHRTHALRLADADELLVVNDAPERRPLLRRSRARPRRVYRIQ